jgi:hypothetical protein
MALPATKLHLHRILYLKQLAGGQAARDYDAETAIARGGDGSEVLGDGPGEQTVLVGPGEEDGQNGHHEDVIENVELPFDIWHKILLATPGALETINSINYHRRFLLPMLTRNGSDAVSIHRLCKNASHAFVYEVNRQALIVMNNVTCVKVNGRTVYSLIEYH